MSESSSTRRFSDRNKRKAVTDDDQSSKKVRNCDKAGCLLPAPTCCLLSNDSCTVSGYTSRWYHMSLGEHFCNNCFDYFYRTGKKGYREYSSWSHEWGTIARASKPNIKRFVANELLPYWLKCIDCGKWRVVPDVKDINHDFIQNFKCKNTHNEIKACDMPEDENVQQAKESQWMMQLVEEPLLKKSPAGPFLKRFLSEDIGLCPTDCTENVFNEIDDIEPFYVGQCGESPIWVKPDEMEKDEEEFAKKKLIFSPTYLGLRNLIVTVWNMSPTNWLTINKINPYIICRGLVRVYLLTISEELINLLTKKCVINYGLINCPPSCKLITSKSEKVIVIGAGMSGLAAAKHLYNIGIDVEVVEARSEPLGRLKQDCVTNSDGILIQGLTNNPFTIMALQAKIKFQTIENNFIVFRDDGEQIPFSVTERVDHELYGLIHGAIEWATLYNKDANWYDTIMSNYSEISKVSQIFCNPDIFHLFLRQFEIEQRADLKQLSLLNWEFVTPLMGNDGILPDGMKSLTEHLTENLTIHYDAEVKTIDHSSDKICVTTSKGEFSASHVLVTIPLSFLRSGKLEFIPPLPEYKTEAIKQLGDYYCEKLIMEFPKRFWTRKIKEPFGKFSVVSPEEIFFIFIDVTCNRKNASPTLLTYISQKSLETMKELSDEMIVEKCMTLLKNLFQRDGAVPKPLKWLLTHWSEDEFGGSYGSFVKVNGTQNAFDNLTRTINDKIYFAGEATFRNIPSTVTGAYLSGLREATKIIKHIETS